MNAPSFATAYEANRERLMTIMLKLNPGFALDMILVT
jgi:hypothetical protein